MDRIDLHCHTTCSDGTDSPKELVRRAKEIGLRAVAITDHDTFRGHLDGMIAGIEYGVEFVPGVELSSMFMGEHIHLLAYYADEHSRPLCELMERAVYERAARNETMIKRLHDAGYPIDAEIVHNRFPGQTMIGRPHISEILMEKGYVNSVREGVVTLMGKGGPFYVPRYHVPLLDYVRAVRQSGGVPVIAHLYQYRMTDEQRRQMIREATDAGLLGLEGMYSTYDEDQQERVFAFAKEFGLICTGGSDYHGAGKPGISLGSGTGDLAVPYAMLGQLKQSKSACS